MNAGRGVTIADVAARAGVATSTVSYVLSGKRSISPDTARRVMDAVAELGYHPHAGARSLASRKAGVVAMMLPLRRGMHLPVLMQFASGAVTEARRHDQDVLLMTADEGPAGLARVAASAIVDGLILMDVEVRDRRVETLRRLGLPSVLIGFPADAEGLTCVDLDFSAAGAECADYLIERGCRDITLLGAPEAVYERRTGFAERVRSGFLDRGRTGARTRARACPDEAVAVQRSVKELLASRPDLDGLAVHNESAVPHVMHALADAGKRVGRDFHVVVIGPDEVAERVHPQLPSVLVPAEELAEIAVGHLMRKLGGLPVPEATLVEPRLTRRDRVLDAPLGQPGQRLHLGAVDPHLEVQVRPGRVPGRPGQRQVVAGTDLLADTDQDLGGVRVGGLDAAAVVDDHEVAVSAHPTRVGHLAGADGPDRLAAGVAVVHPGVQAAPTLSVVGGDRRVGRGDPLRLGFRLRLRFGLGLRLGDLGGVGLVDLGGLGGLLRGRLPLLGLGLGPLPGLGLGPHLRLDRVDHFIDLSGGLADIDRLGRGRPGCFSGGAAPGQRREHRTGRDRRRQPGGGEPQRVTAAAVPTDSESCFTSGGAHTAGGIVVDAHSAAKPTCADSDTKPMTRRYNSQT
nr:LacI family DNA-binding transcriptional regulator [Glycomyces xiaoerkulensis]